jgi:hypothetical protein
MATPDERPDSTVQGDEAQRPRLWVPASEGAREEGAYPGEGPGPVAVGLKGGAAEAANRSNTTRCWLAALVLLIAAGPALTLAGATLLEHRARTEIAALSPAAEPVLARARADAATRAAWAPLLDRAALGTTIERLAASLPADDRLASVASRTDGTLDVTILTADPDALRDALRREPVLAQLREAGQQRGDAAMRVTLTGRPQ